MTSTGRSFAAARSLARKQPLVYRQTQFVLTDLTRDGRADIVGLTTAGADRVDAWRYSMAAKVVSGAPVPVLKAGVRWVTGIPVAWESAAAY
jgi:hypothetical protein